MEFKQKTQKSALLVMLAVTDLFSRFDIQLPTKWHSLIDTLTVSTGVLHSRLSVMDKEVDKEYRKMEKNFERHLGLESFYCPEEIQEIKDEVEKAQLKS